MRKPWWLHGVSVFIRKRIVRKTVYGAIRRRNWKQAQIWMGWSRPDKPLQRKDHP